MKGLRTSDERGSTTVFTAGLLALVLIVVVLVSVAAAVHLERKRLWNLADSIALEVSDAVTYQAHLDGTVSSELVFRHVQEVLSQPRDGLADFEYLTVGNHTGYAQPDPGSTSLGRVTVHLRATHKPGLLPWMLLPWSDGIEIEAQSRSNISRPN